MELDIFRHNIYSEFMSVIQDEVFIRSKFYKFFFHTKKIKDLLSKFESTQQDIFMLCQDSIEIILTIHLQIMWCS